MRSALLRRCQRVAQKHRDGHGADAARNRCHETCHVEDRWIDVSDLAARYWQGALGNLDVLKDERTAPLARLKAYFRRLNDLGRKLKYRPGCMIGNLSVVMSDQSPAIRESLVNILGSWSRAIEACVKEAQADGSLRRDLDAKSMAAFMLNSWEGAVLRSKVDRSDAALVAFEKIVFGSLAK